MKFLHLLCLNVFFVIICSNQDDEVVLAWLPLYKKSSQFSCPLVADHLIPSWEDKSSPFRFWCCEREREREASSFFPWRKGSQRWLPCPSIQKGSKSAFFFLLLEGQPSQSLLLPLPTKEKKSLSLFSKATWAKARSIIVWPDLTVEIVCDFGIIRSQIWDPLAPADSS